jgi:Na+-transporting methylmalonyl-CoA/oxaloacetate decarboxylase gamma subunit
MMNTLEVGLTLLVLGLGGTLATLALLAGCLRVLTRLFPPEPGPPPEPGGPRDG